MTDRFISNSELSKLLSKATKEERLGLTKILDNSKSKELSGKELQEEICACGGHGIANWFRGSGTGYLDIVDDVADALKIEDSDDYQMVVKYFDELFYIIGGGDEKSDSKVTKKYDREQATVLGNEYAVNHEEKIIITVMKNAYKQMESEKKGLEFLLQKLKESKPELEQKLSEKVAYEKRLQESLSFSLGKLFGPKRKPEDIRRDKTYLKKTQDEIASLRKELAELPGKIQEKESKLDEATKRLEEFDSHLSGTIHSYNSTHIGAITGTAGLMVLANLGGFATYTFLTSMMSTLSFGTLGFGAYTAATSFLSVVIGPVGWAGLGLWAIFKLGKPDLNKLVLLVATIGAIRQRVMYEAEHG